MIGTYAAALAVCVASLAIGQAIIALCGRRRWSWASGPVGLAALCAVCWATVRLPGHGQISAIVVLALLAASLAYLQGRGVWREAFATGRPVALLATLAASLPFIVEGHFGILGTSFNPDMSQHLLATSQLAHGHTGQLVRQGYPLGPHSIVVALDKGLDIGLVKGFSGLTVAVAVLAPLTALAAFRDLHPAPRTAAALVVGLAYVVASYFAQGAFKETMLALFLLAFVLLLRETWRDPPDSQLRFVPAALIAVGAAYVYSFPALLWLLGTALVWAITELARTHLQPDLPPAGGAPMGAPRRAQAAPPPSTVGEIGVTGPAVIRSVLITLGVLIILIAPEIGRMLDFHKFETFDPNGPGLGNLFGQVSPFEALGIWPSGDFRLAPGDGAVPAAAYYLGAAFGTVLLLYGIWRCWRRRETVVLAGLFVAAVAYLAARVGGTAYTSAKAIEIAAPLCALTILLPLTHALQLFLSAGIPAKGTAGRNRGMVGVGACVLFLTAAGLCSVLALANAPVGPSSYSPALTGLRPLVADGSTVVLASAHLLADDHGTNYIAWELRGGRVCIETRTEAEGRPPAGVRYVVTEGSRHRPPFDGLRLRKVAKPYVLWEVRGPVAAHSVCPLIAVRQARQGPAR
ncbi:MAG TPA: hypothetical protein VHE08_02245 [Solirubrobacterales bacterium]|nr:hypothetical protein [Solirubrobacterales bacterium]